MTSFFEKYRIVDKIYANSLATSEITMVEDIERNRFACKETRKKRLLNSYFHEFVKNEMVFQYSLSKYSDNIVKVVDYFEDENSYFMVMEYSPQPTYFEDLLENVHKIYFIIF
jgi:serine/threonine protein kinase